MTDVLTYEQRRLNMSRIRGRDTKPELLLRRGLHARGIRFRLHRNDLPGRPDLVLPRFHAVIFVHGCFWHGHRCPMFRMPATRAAFWRAKIRGNTDRDQAALIKLRADNWRVMTVWECALRGPAKKPVEAVIDAIVEWLHRNAPEGTIRGKVDCKRARKNDERS